MVEKLASPGDAIAMEALETVCTAMKRLLTEQPGGPALRLSEACRSRREQADRNSRPLLEPPTPISADDVWHDVVSDSLHALGVADPGRNVDLRKKLERVLVACLRADRACQALTTRHALSFDKDPLKLETLQSVGLERLARIILYLGRATDAQKRAVMQHCLQGTAEGADLAGLIASKKLDKAPDEDRKLLDHVEATATELLRVIKETGVESPYASRERNEVTDES